MGLEGLLNEDGVSRPFRTRRLLGREAPPGVASDVAVNF